MFHLMDLVFPIGIGLLAAILCTVAVIKAKETPAKVVSALTGLTFLASIPGLYAWRASLRTEDYITAYGTRVHIGGNPACTKTNVEAWSKWTVDFFLPRKGSALVLKDKILICLKEEKLSALGRFIRGGTDGDTIVIGWNGTPAYTESLFKHEVGHLFATQLGQPYDEAKQHAWFKEIRYGY